jgi:hypothetical protein
MGMSPCVRELRGLIGTRLLVGGALEPDDDETAELGWFHLDDRPALSIEYPLAEMLSGSPAVFSPPAA